MESSLFLILSAAFLKRKGNTGIQVFDGVAANSSLPRCYMCNESSSVQGVTSMFNYLC